MEEIKQTHILSEDDYMYGWPHLHSPIKKMIAVEASVYVNNKTMSLKRTPLTCANAPDVCKFLQ